MITPDSAALGERRVALMVARAISYLVYAYLLVVEIILLLGFFLLLFGANPSAGFTEWVYRNLDRVMAPFRGIFTPIELGATSGNIPSIFETSVLFAMIVYGIVALAFGALIQWLTRRLHQIEGAEAERIRREEYQDRLDVLASQQAALQADIRAAQAAEAVRQGSSGVSVPTADMQSPPPGATGSVPGLQASPPHEL